MIIKPLHIVNNRQFCLNLSWFPKIREGQSTFSDPYFGVVNALSCNNHAEINTLRALENCLTRYYTGHTGVLK